LNKPVPPPPYAELLWRASDSGRFSAIVASALPDSGPTRPYLAWDKLRHKTPPDDLTHEEWWCGIKLGRTAVLRTVDSLRATDGRPFSYALPDEVLAQVDQITSDASGQVSIDEQVTNPASRDRYIVSSLIEEAITSSQLEGATTSRRVAKDMLRNGRRPRDRSEQMILNNFMAMRRIIELRHEPITPDLVCEIQRIVTDGTLNDPTGAGVLQHDDRERIAVWDEWGDLLHSPPPVAELPERLTRLCSFANATDSDAYVPPVLRAIAVHFMIGYDHYFEDGNGRAARALFYWVMLRNGYWLTEFLTISSILKKAPSQYGQSFLLTEQDDGDLTYFFIYQLSILNRAIAELHKHLATKVEQLRQLSSAIRALPGSFNHRQLALLEHAAKDPTAVYTTRSHAVSHRVSGETARHDLMDLEDRQLLVRFKMGKQFAWSPMADLHDRLST